MDVLTHMVHLAYQFGPFAFALIFLFVMARWGQKKYDESCKREAPPASPGEKTSYLVYFIFVTTVGTVLVAISVDWWWYHQPVYLFEGQINQVADTDSVEGSDFFVHNEYWQQTKDSQSPQIRDIHFVLRHNQPFADGEEVGLHFVRDRAQQRSITLKVNANGSGAYALSYDVAGDAWKLDQSKKTTSSKNVLFAQAYADATLDKTLVPSLPVAAAVDWASVIPTGEWEPIIKPAKPQYVRMVRGLQDPRTLVSQKVEILNNFQSVSTADMDGLFADPTLSEPAFLTFMDLTRHTDPEVAVKAERVLVKAHVPTAYFASLLKSEESNRKKEAYGQFLRLDAGYSDQLLQDLEKKKINITPLQSATNKGNKRLLLVPTGTMVGDKYFVKTEWNDKNSDMTNCLFKTINDFSDFIGPQGLPIDFAKNNNVYYWGNRDKSQAIKYAGEVEKCGATVSFVGYYTKGKTIQNWMPLKP